MLTGEAVYELSHPIFPTGYIFHGLTLYHSLIQDIFYDWQTKERKPLKEPIYEEFLKQREEIVNYWMGQEFTKCFFVQNFSRSEYFKSYSHFREEMRLKHNKLDKFRVPSKDCDNFTCDPGF